MMEVDSAMRFSLERFEKAVYSRDRDAVSREMLKLLQALHANYGGISTMIEDTRSSGESEQVSHFLSRVASALACFLTDPELTVTAQQFREVLALQSGIPATFQASGMGGTDHLVAALGQDDSGDGLTLTSDALARFSLLYSLESAIPL